jgi:molecular chaperone HscB
MGEEDPALHADLEQAQTKFESLLTAVDEELRIQWQVWDAGDAQARLAAQQTMVALLDRRRYLRNLVRDVTETLGAST